jgi:hypothetical protein
MSAPHASQPAAAPEAHPLRASPLWPVRPNTTASAEPRRRPDPSSAIADRDRGLSLLYVFSGAIVVMVADVTLAAAVGHMWILVPVMGIHLLMTLAVFVAIMHLLADGEVPDVA